MRRWRDDPDALDEREDLITAKATLEELYHPEDETDSFETAEDVLDARADGDLVALPEDPSLGFRVTEQAGELAEPARRRSRALPRAAARGARGADLPRGEGPGDLGRAPAAPAHQRDPRPGVPGPAGRDQPRGDPGVLAPHDRLGVRHPPRLRVRRPGHRLPVRPRPPPRPRDPRLRLRAGGDPRHGERAREGADGLSVRPSRS